jgi:putative sterol carrier protein
MVSKKTQSQKTQSQKVNMAAIEKSLTALARKLSNSAPKKRGSLYLHFTDSGQECCLGGTDREFTVSQATDAEPPLVRIAGPSSVLKAIMDGKKEASRAFMAGNIHVSGDVVYLEALLKDLGLLNCE